MAPEHAAQVRTWHATWAHAFNHSIRHEEKLQQARTIFFNVMHSAYSRYTLSAELLYNLRDRQQYAVMTPKDIEHIKQLRKNLEYNAVKLRQRKEVTNRCLCRGCLIKQVKITPYTTSAMMSAQTVGLASRTKQSAWDMPIRKLTSISRPDHAQAHQSIDVLLPLKYGKVTHNIFFM